MAELDRTEFAALRYFARNGTDHHTHAWQGEMIAAYMRWLNARAQPSATSPSAQLSGPGPLPDQRYLTRH
jgi:hypothetical protein